MQLQVALQNLIVSYAKQRMVPANPSSKISPLQSFPFSSLPLQSLFRLLVSLIITARANKAALVRDRHTDRIDMVNLFVNRKEIIVCV
jgi:hypothetical protein